MRADKLIVVGFLLVFHPAPFSPAWAEPPLVSPEDAAHLANVQAQIATTRAKAELAEAEARLAKARREAADGGTEKAAPAVAGPSTLPRAAAARATGEEPVVVRIQRAAPDGPLTAILVQGGGQGGGQGTTLAVRQGAALPNGLHVADITADGVFVAGADDVPRSLAFGAPRR